MVTSTGKGLNVLIRSEYSFSSNWMSFGSWYSVQKNLPDANVAIVCERVLGYDDHRLWPAEVNITQRIADILCGQTGLA